jgi:hypothetical protein
MRVLGLSLILLLAAPAAFAADPAPKTQQTDVAKVSAMLLGTWQDNDNTGFSREFRADGTCVDRSDQDPSMAIAGGWALFNGASPPSDMAGTMRAMKLPTDGLYLRVFQRDDVFLYAMVSVTPQSLVVIDIARQKRRTFLRLK